MLEEYALLPPETGALLTDRLPVYTTTHRKLHDPTARRLENCWWRIWGSNCRYLKGEIVADVYRHISTGPTVVPIKGPENRWEPGVCGGVGGGWWRGGRLRWMMFC
jgi:hypothetical protein